MATDLATITDIIQAYGELSDKIKGIKTETDKYKADIKSYLIDNGLPKTVGGDYEVSIRKSEQSDLNVEKLLPLIKDWWAFHHPNVVIEGGCPWIKTKEYLDLDALESALYNMGDEIPKDLLAILDGCKTTTVNTSLYYSRRKT